MLGKSIFVVVVKRIDCQDEHPQVMSASNVEYLAHEPADPVVQSQDHLLLVLSDRTISGNLGIGLHAVAVDIIELKKEDSE
jgi:hypothetical protein